MKVRVLAVLFSFLIIVTAGYSQEMVTLEKAVALALQKNYDVRLSQNYLNAVETDNRYAPGAFFPQINGVAAKSWTISDQEQLRDDNTIRQKDGTRANAENIGLQSTWLLFDGTRMFSTRARIAELAAQGETNLKGQMTNTIALVITNYNSIVRQKQQLKAIQEQMGVNEERVKLAERKLQVGTGGKPELLQAKVDLNALRTQTIQQETLIQQLKDQLNGLLGMELPASYEIADTIVINLDLKREEIQAEIEKRNFNLISAKQNMEIARLALRERRAEKLPTINFNSSYGYSRQETTVSLNPGVPLYGTSLGVSYGFSASVPILNGFNRKRLVQQAKITMDRQLILYEQQRANVNVGISNAYVNYDNAKRVLLIEEETTQLAKENVFIALESFKRGVATFIELRTAQQSLADAYNRLITARYNAKVAETELLRLSGRLLQ